jgi:hypothetical protein
LALQDRQRRGHIALGLRGLAAIGGVHCRQIFGDFAVQRAQPLIQDLRCDHLLAAGSCDDLDPIDRQQLAAIQRLRAAKPHKGAAYTDDRGGVITPEIGDGLERRRQASDQPQHLQIARRLALQPSTGAHLVHVAVNIELQQSPG